MSPLAILAAWAALVALAIAGVYVKDHIKRRSLLDRTVRELRETVRLDEGWNRAGRPGARDDWHAAHRRDADPDDEWFGIL